MPVKTELFKLWKRKEAEWGRRVSIFKLSEELGVHRNTLSNYLNDNVDSVNFEILDKILTYFEAEAGPVPFLVYEPD